MDSPILFWVGLIFLVAAPFGFWFYTHIGARLRREGGAVHGEGLGPPDMAVTLALGITLTLLSVLSIVRALTQDATAKVEMTPEQVVPGMVLLLALASCVFVFLLVRRVRVAGVMQPTKVSAPRAIGRGALMLLAALPVVGVFSLLAQLLPQDMLQEQELVTLFGDVSKEGNLQTVLLIVLAAVVVAPICEEFVFRGYFYSVWKRYFGATGAALLTSGVFALMHANLASLPGLFALALCLTLAFEASGTILVPMAMHALFNALSLVMLYLRAQGLV